MADTKTLIEAGVGLVLFVYVIAAMAPGAISAVYNTNSTNYSFWGTSILSLWGIIGIFIVITIVLMLYRFVKNNM